MYLLHRQFSTEVMFVNHNTYPLPTIKICGQLLVRRRSTLFKDCCNDKSRNPCMTLTGVLILTSFLLPHDRRQSFCLQCCSNSTSGFGNDGWNKLYALLTTQFYALRQHFNSGTLIDTRMTITPNRSLLTNETTDKGQRSSSELLIAL